MINDEIDSEVVLHSTEFEFQPLETTIPNVLMKLSRH